MSLSQLPPDKLDRIMAGAMREARARAAGPQLKPFRGASLAIQDCRLPEWIIAGPSETSKTVASLSLLDRLARQYPKSQWVMLRKTRKSMEGSVLKRYRSTFEKGGVTAYGGQRPEWFDYPNGSRLWVIGLDNPDKLLSGEFDGAYFNQAEEGSLSDWETITTRTTGRAGNVDFGGMTFGDANPGPPAHWIKTRPTLKLFESRHEDNPALFDENGVITVQGKRTLSVLDALTGVRKERLRYGRWVQAEGTVYQFDAAVHVVDPFAIPADWRRIRVIDFGYTHPFVCQWWAIDGDGRMFLYREIYMTGRTVKTHAAKINNLSSGESYEATIADHDAEDRATLAENGIVTTPATKDILPGINEVEDRLKLAGDGRPRLFIIRGALVEQDDTLFEKRAPTCTEQEFDVYSWPKAKDDKPVKDQPVKLFDHGMDAMRYGAMYLKLPLVTDLIAW